MPEPEELLRRLANHRADQVPDHLEATEQVPLPHRRHPFVLVGAVAAVLVLALVAGALALWPDDPTRAHLIAPGSSAVPTSAPATTEPPPTTTGAATQTGTCLRAGSVTARGPALGGSGPAYISNAIVQAGACDDIVVFTLNAVGAWRASYEDAPIVT